MSIVVIVPWLEHGLIGRKAGLLTCAILELRRDALLCVVCETRYWKVSTKAKEKVVGDSPTVCGYGPVGTYL